MDRHASLFNVRPAELGDERGWRQLWQSYCEFYSVEIPKNVTDSLWHRIMDPSTPIHALIAVTDGGEIVGAANYILHPYTWGTEPICYMEDLFVAEEWRGRGAGSALIGTLAGMAKDNGWPRLYWHTHQLNEVARSLYERFTSPDPFVRYVIRVK